MEWLRKQIEESINDISIIDHGTERGIQFFCFEDKGRYLAYKEILSLIDQVKCNNCKNINLWHEPNAGVVNQYYCMENIDLDLTEIKDKFYCSNFENVNNH